MIHLPFLSAYDPPGSSEGTLDPLGQYQIADQLATRLVPAVRERMQRVRFLTAMAIGALVTDEVESDPEQPDTPPHMIWEWMVVEALIRTMDDEAVLWGVPGSQVARRALRNHGYLDQRSYLKTARIFGFHGVYKRLAVHVGLLDVHMRPRPDCETLVDAWSKDAGYGGLSDCQATLARWRSAVQRSLSQSPARTRTGWNTAHWEALAHGLAPHLAGKREKKCLRSLLHAEDDRNLGALSAMWAVQDEFDDDSYTEECLHNRIERDLPTIADLLGAIRAYEHFCRRLHDAFDILRAQAATRDAQGFNVEDVAKDQEFAACVGALDGEFERARQRLDRVDLGVGALFGERFGRFAAPMTPEDASFAICKHHEEVQKAKAATGKRPWFDRIGPHRIFLRHQYRIGRPTPVPDRYVHFYRGRSVRHFHLDLQ